MTMTDEQEREWFDQHDREHEDPRDFAAECDVCLYRLQDRAENGEFGENVVSVTPGELGIGVGAMLTPIPERGDDGFHSIFWFPYSAREEAEEMVAQSDGKYVLREGVPL